MRPAPSSGTNRKKKAVSVVTVGQSNIYEVVAALGGTIFDYTNGDTVSHQIPYACLTAPAVVRCDVSLNGVVRNTVFAGAGSTHSWWAGAAGPLVNTGQGGGICTLVPGDHLTVTVNAPAAFRIDIV
jgi:hypothetical protein